MLLSVCPSFCQSFCNIFVNSRGHIFYSVLTKLGPHFVHTSGNLLISKFKCQRSRSHLNFNHLLVFILVKTLAYIFQWIWPNLVDTYFIQSLEAYFEGQRSRSQLDWSLSHLTARGYVMLCVAFVIVLSVYYQMFIALQVTIHTWGSNPLL